MKLLVVLVATATLFTSATCNKSEKSKTCFKGKLEIKALCMNYTIGLVEGDASALNVESSWTDESTGKSYSNVFALADPCKFPPDIQAGDEFYFILSAPPTTPCNVCLAYYPKPQKTNAITVVASCP